MFALLLSVTHACMRINTHVPICELAGKTLET